MDDLDLTPRQKLQLAAARAGLMGGGPAHPTLSFIPFGEMTDEQLLELIAWHQNTGRA
jgi:hypothetical protein